MTPILLRADREGERLDQLLARSVDGLTRSAAQRLLEEGAVTLGPEKHPHCPRRRGGALPPRPGGGGHPAPEYPAGCGL